MTPWCVQIFMNLCNMIYFFFLCFYSLFFFSRPSSHRPSLLRISSCLFILSLALYHFNHLSIDQSIYPSIFLSIYLPIYLLIHTQVYILSCLPFLSFSYYQILKLALYELSTEQLLVMSASELADSNTQLLRAQQRSSAALSSQV